ncbi:MAG: UDP-N-acetyl-D-glucosamine dehydrogenase, partial [Bacteroidetes bacterium]|nr:UDP-N-acetyl-D-glucosamine dehydrogenase [Bacteroidota bacterium]
MKLFSEEVVGQLNGKAADLAHRIKNKEAIIGVVGLGYVGMPIALEYCKKGYSCIGVDVVEEKVNSLNNGINFIEDLKDEEVAQAVSDGLLKASTDYQALTEADIIFIAVPTPFNANKDPDISYIINAGERISEFLSPGQLIILKSTTFPGTTESYLIPVLEKSGL